MLEARLLGQFDIRIDGRPVDIPSRPAQTLLAYLLLNAGTPHRREKLAGLLWPEATETNARSNLRHAVWRLRRALENSAPVGYVFLSADNFTVAFDNTSEYWLDAQALEQGAGPTGSLQALEQAVTAYRGELLPGFYAEWIDLERERLRAVFELQVQTLLDRLLAANRWSDVLTWAERWIALGQAPEPAYRALMQAHHALGDQVSVATVYQRCCETLERDLGVEPSAQTRALYDRLRRPEAGALAPSPSPPERPGQPPVDRPRLAPGGLPAPATPFVGREAELVTVAARLRDPVCRLLTLTGPGGIGKTRLALEAARQAASTSENCFADGVHFVPLAAVSASDYVVPAIAEALRFSVYGGDEALPQLLDYLRDKQMLLVLDNFEHLLTAAGSDESRASTAAGLVATILRTAPGVKLMVTSQERLNLQGEWLLEVEGMAFPTAEAEGELDLTSFAAVQLFLHSARRVDSSFRLSPAELPAVLRICRFVSGLPLAIELAAAWVRTISCSEIAGEIERSLGFLSTSLRDVPERHRSVLAVFDYAWRRLEPGEQAAFRKLAVFWGGFQREAAEQVAEAGLGELSALVDKSLLRRAAAGRYEMHGLLRKYGLIKLEEAGEWQAVRDRHLAYFLQLAEQAEPGLRQAEQLAWLARLEVEHDNLRAALKWALTSNALQPGQSLAGYLARFWYLRGYWKEGRAWLNKLLQAGAGGPLNSVPARLARARALMGLGWLSDESGAEGELYAEALSLSRQTGDRWGTAYALRGTAVWLSNNGDTAEARARLDESLQLFRDLDDKWGIGLVHYNLGWLAFGDDDLSGAAVQWDAGLAHFRRIGDRWGLAVTLSALAYVARLRDEYVRASALFEEGLALFRELGDKAGTAVSLIRLAQVAVRRGSFGQAAALVEEGRPLLDEMDDQRGAAMAESLLGLVACYQGEYARATALIQGAIARAQDQWGQYHMPFMQGYHGLVAYYQGEAAQARALWEHALAAHREQEDYLGVGFCLYGLGRLATDRGELEDARHLLDESLANFRNAQDRRYSAAVLNALARVAYALGDEPGGRERLQESLQLRQEIGDRFGLVESLETLADFVRRRPANGPWRAAQLLGAAAALRQIIGAPVPPVERAAQAQLISELRAQLQAQSTAGDGPGSFDAAWAEGRAAAEELDRVWELAHVANQLAEPA